MPKVFKTPSDSPTAIEISGAGVAGPEGKGGVPVEGAKEVMSELQDEGGKPLTGKKLEEAAKDFAEARGLEVVNVAESKIDSLPQEWGVPEPRPPAAEVAEQDYADTFGEEAPDLEAAAEEAQASVSEAASEKE